MSNVLDIIKKRHSIRAFKETPLSDNTIKKLEEALIWAPSAGNLQSRKFYFVFHKKIKHRLAEAALFQMFIAQAPLVIVGCTDNVIKSRYGARGIHLYSIQDVSISLTNAMLVATEEGLASVWVGAFDEKEVSSILSLPEGLRPIAILPVGYADEDAYITDRKPKEELIKYL